MEDVKDVLRIMKIEDEINRLLYSIEGTHGPKSANAIKKTILANYNIFGSSHAGLKDGLKAGLSKLEDLFHAKHENDFLVASIVSKYLHDKRDAFGSNLYTDGFIEGLKIAHCARSCGSENVRKYLEYLGFDTNICPIREINLSHYNPNAKLWRRTLAKPN